MPEKTKLSMGLLCAALMWLFAAFAASPLRAAPIMEENEFPELRNLHREIALLNLVNGLHLSGGQMKELLDVLNNLEYMREQYKEDLEGLMPEMKSAYAALESALVENDVVDPAVEEKAARIHDREIKLKQSYEEDLAGYEKEIGGILSDKQLALVEDFQPCLIPPKKEGQSSIGQANGADSHIEMMLQRVRHIPEDRFNFVADDIIDRYIEHIERTSGVLTDAELAAERRRAADFLYDVREMSDVEYEIRKTGLIERFKEQSEKSQPKQRKRKGEPGKVGMFLLDTSLIPLLEQKLQNSELAENRE